MSHYKYNLFIYIINNKSSDQQINTYVKDKSVVPKCGIQASLAE